MSTNTTIKRIALVAVSALGFGMLSVVPSQAAVTGLTVTLGSNGSAGITAGTTADTSTAASFTVSGLFGALTDTVTVSITQKTVPTGASGITAHLGFSDTTTVASHVAKRGGYSTLTKYLNGLVATGQASATYAPDSTTAFSSGLSETYTVSTTNGVGGYAGGVFNIMLDTASVLTGLDGSYVYTVTATPFNAGTAGTPVTLDVTITVAKTAAAAAAASGTVSSALTTAYINSGTSYSTASDSAVVAVATAATTTHGVIRVRTYTSTGLAAPESVTATLTGPGLICNSSVCGKSITVDGTGTAGGAAAGSTDFTIRADGTAGEASIVVATTTKTFAAKKVTFYAKAAKTIVASVNKEVIAASTNTSVIYANIQDANGSVWAGTAYIYATSAASALIAGSETPASCSYDSTLKLHACGVTGKTVGTASFKVIDASTVAAANVSSNEVSVRVSAAAAAKVTLKFDKATYAPGERAIIWALVVDADGKAIPNSSLANLWAAGAIKSNVSLTAVSSNALTSVSGTVADATDTTTDPNNPTYAGAVTYVVTMPQASGVVELTATGGTSLEAAGRVAVTASAEVVNDSVTAAVDAANDATEAANAATDAANAAAEAADAATAAAQDAQAAVADLAAQVATLISGIKAQITRLTNLVIKIQKKVNA